MYISACKILFFESKLNVYCKAAAASVSVMKPRVILYHVGLGEQGNPFGVCNPTAVPVFRGAAGLEFVIPGNPRHVLGTVK